MEKEISELEDQLEDATLYERDAALFERLSKRLAAAQGRPRRRRNPLA